MILLSLLGEQPIPNLLPLWQDKTFTAVRFVATRATLPLARTLAGAIRQDHALRTVKVLEPLPVEAYDLQQTRAVLAAALAQYQLKQQPVRLNLTGGTKLMSLAALQAAFGSGVPLLYVSTELNQIIHLAADGSERGREPIAVKISVEQYLRAHGLEVADNQAFRPAGRVASQPGPGGALERKVFAQAQTAGGFDDVRGNLFVRKQTDRGPVVNELDLVVIRNGRLAVCSCKTTSAATAVGRDKLREAIYELASLSRREAIGIYCGKVLVSSQLNLPDVLRDRARASGVHLVYGPELSNVAAHLRFATDH